MRMKNLCLVSILLFTTFSEGLRRSDRRRQKRPIWPKRTSLYSRVKKDLDGVEERIQEELKTIVDTVTELKNITEDALVDSAAIEEVESALDEDEYNGILEAGRIRIVAMFCISQLFLTINVRGPTRTR